MSDDHLLPATTDPAYTQPVSPTTPDTGYGQGPGYRPQPPAAWQSPAQQPVQQPVQPYGQPSVQGQSYQPVGYGHGLTQTTPARPQVGGAHIAIAWVLTVLTLGYFLPWAIAATRQKSNTLAIGLVNFLVGWTVLGWVAALVMACLTEPTFQVNNVAYAVTPVLPAGPPAAAAAGWYPDGTGQRRYWDGRRWTQHTAP